ncbi:hypothetical protein [Aeromonas salmonicida]|uniref:hypothetical protein n=1 Tax=Aeromonas salmonicida TaxID=645 RepID=UPI001111E61A|nr:hypothetical protein [Aeromonas salmonicida]
MNKVYFNDYFMTRFLFDKLESKVDLALTFIQVGDVIKHGKLPFLLKAIKVRFVPFIYLFIFYMLRVLRLRTSNKSYEGTVFYFSVENMYELTLLLYHNRTIKRHVLWLWNPASSFGKNKYDKWVYLHLFIPTLKFVGVELWSFDKADVNKYMFTYHPQVHNSFNLKQSGHLNLDGSLLSEKVFLFVGLDKGRLKKLSNLKSLLSRFKVGCEFHITADVGVKYLYQDSLLVRDCYLPYAEYLYKISKSFGLIDFVQNGQSGLTLRALEATFLKKKLITNNLSIKYYDFFNPSNIFILDENEVDYDGLALFLKSDYVEMDDKILEKYDLNHLLESVFN